MSKKRKKKKKQWLLTCREMQIKAMGHHGTSGRMDKIKNTKHIDGI
jgi:hypothetical protein